MGNFIDMAAVLAPKTQVEAYIATQTVGGAARCVAKEPDRTLVIYGESTGDFDRIRKLSKEISAVAFALHIHDDDLWLYELYSSGDLLDRFNTRPHYWQELSDEEAATWGGSSAAISANWPGVTASQVIRYLHTHGEVDTAENERAYADDQSAYGDCWQVCDFLRKLGTPYPE